MNNLWDKLTRVVVILIGAAALLGVLLWYLPVFQQNERMRKDKLSLDRQIEKEQETARKLDASTKALQDPRTVERLAREKLSYAKPGETVVHFESQPNATNTPVAVPAR